MNKTFCDACMKEIIKYDKLFYFKIVPRGINNDMLSKEICESCKDKINKFVDGLKE